MHWTLQHHDPWPVTPPPGLLDVAAERMVRIAFLDKMTAVPVAMAYLGLGPNAGRHPRSVNDATGGVTRSEAEVLRRRLRDVAKACGPPTALTKAVTLIQAALPASSGRLAAMMIEAGLTKGVLHPMAVQALNRLWSPERTQWLLLTRPGSADEVVVDRDQPQQRDLLPKLTRQVRAAGVFSVDRAVGILLEEDIAEAQAVDLLEAWGLTEPNSKLVWDRLRPGRLLRPVQRALAAGPLPVDEVLVGLHRTRHGFYSPTSRPTAELLLAWAEEHPALRVVDVEIQLAPGSDDVSTPADRIILELLREHGSPAPVALLAANLLLAGAAPNPNAAKTQIAFAPYLRGAGRGWVATAHAQSEDETAEQID
jgi:hypothetical protein